MDEWKLAFLALTLTSCFLGTKAVGLCAFAEKFPCKDNEGSVCFKTTGCKGQIRMDKQVSSAIITKEPTTIHNSTSFSVSVSRQRTSSSQTTNKHIQTDNGTTGHSASDYFTSGHSEAGGVIAFQSSTGKIPPPKCPMPLEFDTNSTYYYRYLGIPIGDSRIDFEVKAKRDVHIALSPSKSSYDLYEVVFGAGNNTRSLIRRCKQCENKLRVETDHYLSVNEFRRFWITFGNNGVIAVGRSDETIPFMKWTDPVPLDIHYLGYSTGWGSSGEFRFCGMG